MQQKLNQIKKDLKIKIILNRKRIMKKLNLLRLAHERKKNKYRQQIQDVRRKLTENMIKAEKKGDYKNCVNAILRNQTEEYCSSAFGDDPYSLGDCVKNQNFCYLCCENEFGDMHNDDRDLCTNKCEDKKEKIPSKNYKWIMVNSDEDSLSNEKIDIDLDLTDKNVFLGGNLLK